MGHFINTSGRTGRFNEPDLPTMINLSARGFHVPGISYEETLFNDIRSPIR